MFEQLIGQHLGRYRIDALIGEGGMGAVYHGFDATLQRPVAVKVLAPQFARQPSFRERFLQEARSAARLRHPGIVQVFDYGEAPGSLFIVMELIPGDNLRQMMKKLRQAHQWILLSEGLELVRQICLAIDYAHRQGVLHRDIKPANVMLRGEASDGLPYQPIVTDLGLAKLAEGGVITQVGTSLGTPAYMSPEQAMGETTDARSDVYSIGIMLYELSTGELPFPIRTLTEAIRYHTQVPPPPPRSRQPALRTTLEQVILKTLEKEADRRYQDARQLAEALTGEVAAARQEKEQEEPSWKEVTQVVSLLSLYQPLAEAPRVVQPGPESTPIQGDGLLVVFPDRATQMVPLGSKELTIGRGADNDVVLDLPGVSRHHARVTSAGGEHRIEDLNSTNGTFLDGMKLLPNIPEPISPGSVLRVSDVMLRLQRGERRKPGEVVESTQVEGGVIRTSQVSGRVGIYMEATRLTVAPGGQLVVAMRIYNQGALVDHFDITVDGLPREWVDSLPPPVRLMPGQQQEVQLVVQPPRAASALAGAHTLTIRVSSQVDPAEVAELEAVVIVGAYRQFTVDVRPRRQSGIRQAAFRVLVTNGGNEEITVQLEAIGSEGVTRFAFDRDEAVVAAGGEEEVQLTVSSATPLIGESIRPHPFTILARAVGSTDRPQQVQGVWEQGLPTFELALRPPRARSTGPATFAIAVTSRATSAMSLRLEGSDAEGVCLFEIQPDTLVLDSGAEGKASLTVSARSPLPGEAARVHSFTVTAVPEDAPGAARRVEGEWEQLAPAFALELAPARQGSILGSAYTVQLTNQSDTPLDIQLEAADGEAACLFILEQPQVRLPPGERRSARLTVRPRAPLPGESARAHVFTVRARATDAPAVVREAQGEWQQLPPDFRVGIRPSRVAGRVRGPFTVTVTNESDVALTMKLEATDAEGACRFVFDPPQVVVAGGQQATVSLVATSRERPQGKEALIRSITVAAYAAEAPRVLRQAQAEWEQLPGGRGVWAALPMNVMALAVFTGGWGLALGVFGSLAAAGVDPFILTQIGFHEDLALRLFVAILGVVMGGLGGGLSGVALRLAEPSVGSGKWLALAVVWALSWGASLALFVF
jgi:serine/threonine protein kinase/P pilus assembly chaperone PapD